MEYLVNISKRRAFWSLNEDILKITVLTTNTPYPSRMIRRIRACTHQRPQRKHDQYAVSKEDQYAALEIMDDPNITIKEYIRLEEKKLENMGKCLTEKLLNMALLSRNQRHQYLRVRVFNFKGVPNLMAEGLSARMLMEYRDAHGVSLFISWAWRLLFDIRGPLVHELILEFFSTFMFGEAVLDLDMLGALQFQLGGAWCRLSWRQFILALGLHTVDETKTVGFERQPDAAAGAPRVAQDDPFVDEGDQAVLCEVIGAMARDFYRFTICAASGIAQLLDSARVTYMTYFETRIPYQHRVRQRTGYPHQRAEWRREIDFNCEVK
nr:hypothetical protein [Tanacetum cinerariifolium]